MQTYYYTRNRTVGKLQFLNDKRAVQALKGMFRDLRMVWRRVGSGCNESYVTLYTTQT